MSRSKLQAFTRNWYYLRQWRVLKAANETTAADAVGEDGTIRLYAVEPEGE